jgi:hypothetical protein
MERLLAERDAGTVLCDGWVKGWRYSLVFEIRNDDDGEYYQMVTLWKAR